MVKKGAEYEITFAIKICNVVIPQITCFCYYMIF